MMVKLSITYTNNLPVSQAIPMYPLAHVHVYLFTWSLQMPPCLQGKLAHSSMSGIKHIAYTVCFVQLCTYVCMYVCLYVWMYYAVCINIIYSNITPVNSPYLCYGYVLVGLFYGYVVNVRYGKSTRLVPTCNYILGLLYYF